MLFGALTVLDRKVHNHNMLTGFHENGSRLALGGVGFSSELPRIRAADVSISTTAEVRMPPEMPKSTPPAKPGALLKDLPAQPVDEKEAEGVKGGTALEIDSVRTGSSKQP
jgi:hypothetical protein